MFRDRPKITAGVVSGAYLAAGLAWITFSDRLGMLLFSNQAALSAYQTYKGAAFVAASAALLFFVVAQARSDRVSSANMKASGLPLGALLIGLVAATALPLLILVADNLRRQTESAAAAAEALLTGVVASTSSDLNNHLQVRERVLSALMAQLSDRLDKGACGDMSWSLASLEPALRNIVVFEEGKVACTWRNEAFRTPAAEGGGVPGLAVSNPFRSPIDKAWLLALTYEPEQGAQGRARAIQMVVPAGSLEPLLQAPLPQGGTVTLVGAGGVILARSPDGGFVGQTVRDPVAVENLRTANTAPGTGRDGVERVYASRMVPRGGLQLLAGVPSDYVYGPVRTEALRGSVITALVLVLSGVLVLLIMRRIALPLFQLSAAAERVAAGDTAVRAAEIGPPELRSVARQFNRLLETLPRLREALSVQELKHRNVLERITQNVPGLIFQFRVEPGGRTSLPYASQGIYRLFETDPETVATSAQVVFDRIQPADAQRIRSEMTDLHRVNRNLRDTIRVVLPLGGERTYLVRANPEAQPDGTILWHGCIVDVTELEQAKQELAQAKDRLELSVEDRTRELAAANEALESFSYSVAHDLRAPVAAVRGFSAVLRESTEKGDTARSQHLASRIEANAARMDLLIDGLLSLARTTRPLQEIPTDMGKLVREALSDVQPPAHVQVEVAALPRVHADPTLMRQVLTNLLGNAVKFSADCAAPRVSVSCAVGDELVFTVSDNGSGFEQEYAEKLFAAFSRLHTGVEGTGIGLTIVRRIVERHGGRVWAEGEAGRGARFHFALPRERLVAQP